MINVTSQLICYCIFDFLCRKYEVKIKHIPFTFKVASYTRILDTIDQLSVMYFTLMIINGIGPYTLMCTQIIYEMVRIHLQKMGMVKDDNEKRSIERMVLLNFIASSMGLYLTSVLPSALVKGIEYILFWMLSFCVRSRFKARSISFDFYTSLLFGFYSLTNDLVFMFMGAALVFPHISRFDSEVKSIRKFSDSNSISLDYIQNTLSYYLLLSQSVPVLGAITSKLPLLKIENDSNSNNVTEVTEITEEDDPKQVNKVIEDEKAKEDDPKQVNNGKKDVMSSFPIFNILNSIPTPSGSSGQSGSRNPSPDKVTPPKTGHNPSPPPFDPNYVAGGLRKRINPLQNSLYGNGRNDGKYVQ